MKKILLALVLMVPMISWGQNPNPRSTDMELTLNINAAKWNPNAQNNSNKINRDNISFSDYDIAFSGVEKVEGLSANDLYNATLTWLESKYEHPNDVIRINTAQKIVIEGRTGIHITDDSDINCIITFEFKDGRYKWSINDCIIIDNFMRALGHSDKRIRDIPRYNRASATQTLINDFSPFVESFRSKIRAYHPGVTPIPSNLSNDW